jgi:hypothetical protein
VQTVLSRGENLSKLEDKSKDLVIGSNQIRKKSVEAKKEMASQNETCCGCIPQKSGLMALFYGYGIGLVFLLINDVFEMGYSMISGIICFILHCTFFYVAGLFMTFKKNDYRLPTEDEDPNVD